MILKNTDAKMFSRRKALVPEISKDAMSMPKCRSSDLTIFLEPHGVDTNEFRITKKLHKLDPIWYCHHFLQEKIRPYFCKAILPQPSIWNLLRLLC